MNWSIKTGTLTPFGKLSGNIYNDFSPVKIGETEDVLLCTHLFRRLEEDDLLYKHVEPSPSQYESEVVVFRRLWLSTLMSKAILGCREVRFL